MIKIEKDGSVDFVEVTNPAKLGAPIERSKRTIFDELGDQVKALEGIETERKAQKNQILLARLDGRSFHNVTKHFDKPFDKSFIEVMTVCAEELVQDFGANCAYVQSDEISLMWELPSPLSEFPFGGKFHKINSVAASSCSNVFNLQYMGRIEKPVMFDCRSWAVPGIPDAIKVFRWRQMDAKKNAINMVAHHLLGHKRVLGVNEEARLELIKKSGYDWDGAPGNFKFGTFIKPIKVSKVLTMLEMEKIPEKHRPTGPVVRTEIKRINTDITGSITEAASVIFFK